MSHVITYKPKGSSRTLAISDLDSTDGEVFVWCKTLALTMEKVVLHRLEENGLLIATDQFVPYGRGVRHTQLDTAQAVAEPVANPRRVRAPRPAAPEPQEPAEPQEQPAEDEAVAEEMPEVADSDDTEAHTYEAYCVKCKEKRAFVGHVVEMANGSKAAQGTCPVCSTKVSRMVKRDTPVDDWDEPSDSGQPAVPAKSATEPPAVEFAEAHEDIPAELQDKAPANAPAKKAPAKQTAKKAAPAKKTAAAKKSQPAKANAEVPEHVHCTYCDVNVPIKVSGDGKLRTASIHPKVPGKSIEEVGRCTGSQATVDADGKMV